MRELFRDQGVGGGVEFVQGLFQDTISHCPIEGIARLHIAGEWYESVKVGLDAFYTRWFPEASFS